MNTNVSPNKFLSVSLPAIVACILWSTAFVGVKYGLKYAKPLGFAGIRFMISGLLLVPFFVKEKNIVFKIRQQYPLILSVAFLQTFILYALFYSGIALIPGSLGAIVIGASPLFSALTAHFVLHNDKMNLFKFISIGVGVSGIVLISITRQPLTLAGFLEFIGIILLIFATISSAFGNILVSVKRGALPAMMLNSLQIFTGGLFLFLLSLIVEGPIQWKGPILFYVDLIWLAILSAVAFSIWFALLKRPDVKVSELNLWKFLIPGFGAMFSWILLPDEYPELYSIIGIVLVASSIILYFSKSD